MNWPWQKKIEPVTDAVQILHNRYGKPEPDKVVADINRQLSQIYEQNAPDSLIIKDGKAHFTYSTMIQARIDNFKKQRDEYIKETK